MFELSEIKWKGKGKIAWGNVEGLGSGANENEHSKEGVAILLGEEMWECVKGSEETSSRIICVQLKLFRRNLIIVSVYAPGSERG